MIVRENKRIEGREENWVLQATKKANKGMSSDDMRIHLDRQDKP